MNYMDSFMHSMILIFTHAYVNQNYAIVWLSCFIFIFSNEIFYCCVDDFEFTLIIGPAGLT